MDQRNTKFRGLVEQLVEKSKLLPPREIRPGETLDILTAIETNEVTVYTGPYIGDEESDAIEYLIHIFDELGRESPDEVFIQECVEDLSEILNDN
jgi:hypothetical protein